MTRNRFRLFYWLAILGALSGYLLGELILGTGNGLFVAPVAAIVGLLLAWALHHTRSPDVSAQAAKPVEQPAPRRAQERQPKTTNTVRVAKSRGGKRR